MTRDIAPDDGRDRDTTKGHDRDTTNGRERDTTNGHDRDTTNRRERDTAPSSLPIERLGYGPRERSPERNLERERTLRLPTGLRREPVAVGVDRYRLRGSEVETLVAVGTFRSLFARDLEHYENATRRDADVYSLRTQGLLDRRTMFVKGEPAPVEVLTLTRAGKRLLESQRAMSNDPDAQQFHAGWARIPDLLHDASLYRMVEEERRRIEGSGGAVRRVVLDHELSAEVHRALNRVPRILEVAWEQNRDEVAASHDLTVTDGHVRFPDVRLEYDTAAGDRRHVDLELVTEHYHPSTVAGKRAAGFRLYRLGGRGSGRAGGAPHDPRRLGSMSR